MEIQTEGSPFPFPPLSSCSGSSTLNRGVYASGNLRNNQSCVAIQLATDDV